MSNIQRDDTIVTQTLFGVAISIVQYSKDTSRGHHGNNTTVSFQYSEFNESRWTPEWERRLVDAICLPDSCMWYRVTVDRHEDRVVYTVEHGYDSGD